MVSDYNRLDERGTGLRSGYTGRESPTARALDEFYPERTNMSLLEMMQAGLMLDTPSRRAAGMDQGLLASLLTPSLNRQPLQDGRIAGVPMGPVTTQPAAQPVAEPAMQASPAMSHNGNGGPDTPFGIGGYSQDPFAEAAAAQAFYDANPTHMATRGANMVGGLTDRLGNALNSMGGRRGGGSYGGQSATSFNNMDSGFGGIY